MSIAAYRSRACQAIGGDDGAGGVRTAVGEVLLRGVRPRRHSARMTWLGTLAFESRTCVFFESPRRLAETLKDAVEALGPRPRGRRLPELTKTHEEIVRGSLAELSDWAKEGVLGEITVVLAGPRRRPTWSRWWCRFAISSSRACGSRMRVRR